MLYTHHLRGPTQLDECFNFWYECFNFLPAFFHTLEIPPSLPKNPVHVTGSQRFWPLDVGLNTLTRNSAVLQCKFCPINFLLLTHTQCTFQTSMTHTQCTILRRATERRQIYGDFLLVFASCPSKHYNVALLQCFFCCIYTFSYGYIWDL